MPDTDRPDAGADGRVNRRVVVARRPAGPVTPDCFALDEAPVPHPAEGEALVRVLYLSLDPTIRGWISHDGYLPVVPLGDVVRSGAAGVVVESRNDAYQVGTPVFGMLGWQDYALIGRDDAVPPLPLAPEADLTEALSVFGVTGITAYFGVFDIGQPKEGETFVVSGAAGATGSIAGQLAKIAGCKVVGVAGGPEKCRWIVDDLGFDTAIDYKNEDVGERLDETCPEGIDVYYDNVGGEILDQALKRIRKYARVVLCGAISTYETTSTPPGPRNYYNLVAQHGRMEGFLLFDYLDRMFEALERLERWVREGRIVNRVQVVDGLEKAPETFGLLFSGGNTGKLLVKVADR